MSSHRNRFRSFLPLAAALVGAVLLGAPSQARAGFTLTIAEGGGPSVVVNDNGVGDSASASGLISFVGTVGDFSIQASIGSSNAPGTAKLAQLTINNLSISALGFSGDKTLTITLQDDSFTSPTGHQGMESQLSVSLLPVSSTVTFQSFLNGNGGTLLSLSGVGGKTADDSVNISSTPYTLENITTYTIHGAGSGNALTIQTTGITAVMPAPPGLLLALTGMPCLGLGCWLRRRKTA